VKIFISYRRADSIDVSGRLFDRLVAEFGSNNVFKDVDSIPLGIDFERYIREQLVEFEFCLVIIGKQWLEVKHSDGTRRLDDQSDYVRIEIEQALAGGLKIIPVLVGDAQMPAVAQLPESLQFITKRNAISIRPDPDFHRDVDRLIRGIDLQTSTQVESVGQQTKKHPAADFATTTKSIVDHSSSKINTLQGQTVYSNDSSVSRLLGYLKSWPCSPGSMFFCGCFACLMPIIGFIFIYMAFLYHQKGEYPIFRFHTFDFGRGFSQALYTTGITFSMAIAPFAQIKIIGDLFKYLS
jgi:TIR domain